MLLIHNDAIYDVNIHIAKLPHAFADSDSNIDLMHTRDLKSANVSPVLQYTPILMSYNNDLFLLVQDWPE